METQAEYKVSSQQIDIDEVEVPTFIQTEY